MKYVDYSFPVWKDIYTCKRYQGCLECSGRGRITGYGFVPPDLYKGQISRAVLYMADKYPEYHDKIFDRVLSLETALKWNETFPEQEIEVQWREYIKNNTPFFN